MRKITIGISSCLLGNPVRFDGGHKHDHFLAGTLARYIEWIPVCPEAACGLGIPREAMHLAGVPSSPRIRTVWTGIDHTPRIRKWIRGQLKVLRKMDLSGYVFKARSPSCGLSDAKVFDANVRVRSAGPGIFARAVMEWSPLLPLTDEEAMRDPAHRENFIERIFVFQRWMEYLAKDGTRAGLAAFHREHEFLTMAHGGNLRAALGKTITGGKAIRRKELHARYGGTLMEGMKTLATTKKHAVVLRRLAGYFRDRLSAAERKELADAIRKYHAGRLPLIVPIALINHYARIYGEGNLAGQRYLHPSPLELMLRNHS